MSINGREARVRFSSIPPNKNCTIIDKRLARRSMGSTSSICRWKGAESRRKCRLILQRCNAAIEAHQRTKPKLADGGRRERGGFVRNTGLNVNKFAYTEDPNLHGGKSGKLDSFPRTHLLKKKWRKKENPPKKVSVWISRNISIWIYTIFSFFFFFFFFFFLFTTFIYSFLASFFFLAFLWFSPSYFGTTKRNIWDMKKK